MKIKFTQVLICHTFDNLCQFWKKKKKKTSQIFFQSALHAGIYISTYLKKVAYYTEEKMCEVFLQKKNCSDSSLYIYTKLV